MKNILIFPCDSEIAREVLEALKYNKNYKLIGGTSVKGKGRYLPYDDIINIPDINTDGFESVLNTLCDKYEINYVFPCHDDVCLKMSSIKHKYNFQVITHSWYINSVCRNKQSTYELFKDYDFCPKYELKKFPRFVKPKNSNGSRGAQIINSQEELDFYFKSYEKNNTLQLEYLSGDEFTVDCFSHNGNLLFAKGRRRNTTKMGIAEISTSIKNEEINKEINLIALQINDKFNDVPSYEKQLNGAWFFQVKFDKNNKLKLLEIGPRISGGMSFYRMQGINFPELSIIAENKNIDIKIPGLSLPYVDSFCKFFIPKFKHGVDFYNDVYVDFDDTLYLHKNKEINTDLVKLLYQSLNKGKKLHLITRSSNNFQDILKKYRLEQLWDTIIHIKNEDIKKYSFINPNSVLIDDSFRERDFYKKGVVCFGLDNFNLLIND